MLRRLLAVGWLVACSLGCGGGGGAPERPDVILIVVDTLRADHLGCYGYSRPTSPRIDAMAQRGVVFDAAWSAAPWTLPSIMSIMTSLYPSSHRVENDGLRLAEGVPTLASSLRDAGYTTGGFVSHVYVTAPFGFDRGFQRFEDFGLSRPTYRPEAEMEPTAERVTGSALDWVRSQDRKPIFLFVHYFDPHWPYAPPPTYRALFGPADGRADADAAYDAISRFIDPLVPIPDDYRRFLIDRYDGEIRYVDDQIGRLLEGAAEARKGMRRVVVVTGDHGEEFKEHGSMGHGRQLYEEVIHVPLIILEEPGGAPAAGPDRAAGGAALRVAAPVSGIDLAPTLVDLAGVAPAPAGFHGRSLRPLLHGAAASGTEPPPRTLVSETVRLSASAKAVRTGPWKLIHFMDENRSELYDLAEDPSERRDRGPERQDERRRLMQAMFSEVDLLSGGWNLRWAGDGHARRFTGRITTTGIFRTIVPLFADRGKYGLKQGSTLEFNDAGQAGESGLSFTTTPYDAPVTFFLSIDGRAVPAQVSLGGGAAHPGAMPFTLEGNPKASAAFRKPESGAAAGGVYRLWRTRPATPDQPIVLDEEMRERLRSLGYVD